VDACRREPDHRVARCDGRAVDEVAPGDDAHARAGEVELSLGVDARQLRRLSADECDAGRPADACGAFDELGHLVQDDLVRGDVVEEQQRVGAARGDVVDAVRGEVGAAVAEAAALPRQDQLRPDAVGGRGEEPLVVERVQAGEGPEAVCAGRLDRRTEALDDRPCGRERDPCGGVAALRAQAASVRSGPAGR
jgi:hypothetical protein